MTQTTTPATVRHTPGPWNANNDKSNHRDKACAVWTKHGEAGEERFICSGRFPNGSRNATVDEMHANMTLIAAAPELLAELRLVEVQLDIKVNLTDPEMIATMLRRVRDVIAKATCTN